ncbi:hypothetical protein [Leptolyngbya sp. Heron Island J]|uniref:hypothetical protein n=1 Tax=Leptolyngbya sp. Heron Island J TaxID=1385935 RepID=UPI000425AF5D|nr:hypothetical protein [Leptolyngbya sp. Heron Island J]
MRLFSPTQQHPELRQVTVCCWDNGLYEDTVFTANEPLKSAIVPELNLSPGQIFGNS